LYLTIEDNGKGFDPNLKTKGIGLKNIKSRVELYSGDMKIISEPGNGCVLEVSIKL
jgi:two-component system sensor histidine kinase UhpB